MTRDVFTMRLSQYERGLLEQIAADQGRRPTEMMREILRQYASMLYPQTQQERKSELQAIC